MSKETNTPFKKRPEYISKRDLWTWRTRVPLAPVIWHRHVKKEQYTFQQETYNIKKALNTWHPSSEYIHSVHTSIHLIHGIHSRNKWHPFSEYIHSLTTSIHLIHPFSSYIHSVHTALIHGIHSITTSIHLIHPFSYYIHSLNTSIQFIHPFSSYST